MEIDNTFIKQLSDNLKPKTSALFVLLDSDITEHVLDDIKGTGDIVIQTS